MKHLYITVTFLLTIFTLSAQVPTNYYSSATGNGYALKTQLKNIINNSDDGLTTEYQSSDLGYSALYTTFSSSDIDLYFENNGTLLDMYSENPSGTDAYEYSYGTNQDDGSGGTAEGQKYNREHIIPQSVFDGNSPMKNDAHFVVPSDKYINAQRGSFPFGVVETANFTSTNNSKRGNNLDSGYSAGYTNTVFEPIDEFKGDIARMYFYFVTRYEDNFVNNDFDSYAMFNDSADQVFELTFFNILYQWHTQDPVSQRELDRNNAIFNAQNNRNPFIDNPTYVSEIWQGLLSVDEFTAEAAVKIYPNPVKGSFLNIEVKQNTSFEIYDILGKKILDGNVTPTSKQIGVSQLNKGVYILKLETPNGGLSKKLIKS
ncbi:endonuclease [Lacinutrix jangbogonensis]|uniref:endonuclease n=1 Tax=Lacinutrix jangbogonensis TaxID=1469557 RepID=UPI00053DF9BB|nr:endonuclease [Lacinutrix jangbogonensis]